jgi:hypothetical protein
MNLVRSTELAYRLGITERWLKKLKKDGVIKSDPSSSRLFELDSNKEAFVQYKLRSLRSKGLMP